MTSTSSKRAPAPLAHPVNETAQILGVSRSRVYELLAVGHLVGKKEGRRTLILRTSLEAYLDSLPSYVPGELS